MTHGGLDAVMARLVDELSTMPAGARLASERALAERLGVSRTSLRDRIARLESMGVLDRRSGSGTYVQDMSAGMLSESLTYALLSRGLGVDAMIPVRWALEREAARRAAAGQRDKYSMREMEDALEGMAFGNPSREMRAADEAFHTALLKASGSPGLQFVWETMWAVLASSIQEVVAEQAKAEMHAIHSAIFVPVADRDPVAAVYAVDQHFQWSYSDASSSGQGSLSLRAEAANREMDPEQG
ncbi:MAG: FCD domain-containing protein [Brooklawnia sp.]|uniref:FadR/GntR family transcriptional regulator n=1 Tax=Brooklawnia sp. TaxID=2699740 RepID=UPI003C710D3A